MDKEKLIKEAEIWEKRIVDKMTCLAACFGDGPHIARFHKAMRSARRRTQRRKRRKESKL